MKKIAAFSLLLACGPFAAAQQVGLSLGTALFQPSASYGASPAPVPKNLCMHLQVFLSNDVKINASGGYGWESGFFKRTAPGDEGTLTHNYRIHGFPVEVELVASKPLVLLSGIRAFIGVGCGYYTYKATAETERAPEKMEFDSRIDGFGQYFTFGAEFRLHSRVSGFLQFKKLGISGLKSDQEDPLGNTPFGQEPTKTESSIRSENGFNDLSVTVGVLFGLRSDHDSSILENLTQ
jgi:hypothetical protein